MAVTTNPLVWDFYREINDSGSLGGVVHYYNEEAQSFLNTPLGLCVKNYTVRKGDWENSLPSRENLIDHPDVNDIANFDIDHPYNGTLFCTSVNSEGELFFCRYVYSVDCSTLITSGSLDYSNNNSVSQIKVNIMNINEALFEDETTIFQPGAKITFKLVVGDEVPYDMAVMFLDSSDYSRNSSNIPISGRNAIGFKLMDSTFDDVEIITGTVKFVIESIFILAGIDDYVIYESAQTTQSRTYKFKPTQNLMSGIEQVLEYYTTWKLVELPSGLIVVGPSSFVNEYQPSNYYVFDFGSLFQRKIKRSSDAAYTKVRVTGKDYYDNDLTPVTLPVNNWDKWALPSNKTYHHNAPGAYSQTELNAYATNLANTLQYVGIGEDYTGPIKPHLLIGDVASVNNGDGTMTNLGIVTSVKHRFGLSGYYTDFSIDSGGLIMNNARNTYVTTQTKSLEGYTRKQTLKDMIKIASQGIDASKVITEVTKVVTSSDAETIGGKTYEQIVAEVKEAVLKDIGPNLSVKFAEQDGDTLNIYGAYSVTQNDDTLEVT